MKKSLMATTALVAASVAISGAHAQDDEMMEEEMMAQPISLSVGGYAAWGVSFSSYEGAEEGKEGEQESLGIANSSEVHFGGSTVLDNGLEISARFELEGTTTSDQIDETWVSVEGSFGELRIGNEDMAAYILSASAPQASGLYGANTPSFSTTQISPLFISTLPGGPDSASVLYFTPVVNGFQFGVSYAPESKHQVGQGVGTNTEGNAAASAGANYGGSIGENTSITLAAGVVNTGDDGTAGSEDTTDVAAGMKLSRGAYSIGASYRSVDDGTDEATISYEMGAQYSSGPWAVSLNWAHSEDDDDATAGGDVYRLLGSYDLGASVSLAGAIGMDQPEEGKDSRLFGMGLSVGF